MKLQLIQSVLGDFRLDIFSLPLTILPVLLKNLQKVLHRSILCGIHDSTDLIAIYRVDWGEHLRWPRAGVSLSRRPAAQNLDSEEQPPSPRAWQQHLPLGERARVGHLFPNEFLVVQSVLMKRSTAYTMNSVEISSYDDYMIQGRSPYTRQRFPTKTALVGAVMLITGFAFIIAGLSIIFSPKLSHGKDRGLLFLILGGISKFAHISRRLVSSI